MNSNLNNKKFPLKLVHIEDEIYKKTLDRSQALTTI